MNIQEVLKTLIAQVNFERTSSGRSVTDAAIESMNATISDQKNYNVNAIKCMNCNLILSSILTTKGCVNCGAINLTTNVEKGDIL